MMTVIIFICTLITAFSYLYEGKNIYFGVRLPLAFTITEEMKSIKRKYIFISSIF